MLFRFENFELDSDQHELRRDGEPQKMEPQVFTLLAYFVSNPDRLITKDEIIEKIWDGRFISDAAINSRIRSVRNVLGDDGKAQRLIKTVHSRGFRFVGDVTTEGVVDPSLQTDPPTLGIEKDIKPNTTIAPTKPGMNKLILAGFLVAIMLVGFFAYTQWNGGPNNDENGSQAETFAASIAVLPFSDMSADADRKYLGDGIAEELLNTLARVEGLKVTSRTSAFTFRGKDQKISDIGKALNVNHVLEGSVRQLGSTIRVTAQLIDAKSDSHVWSKTYDRPMNAENLFQVQDEIVASITTELMGQLNLPDIVSTPRMASIEGYELFLRGNELTRKSTPAALQAAIELYDQAIAIDDKHAPLFAARAVAYELSNFYAGITRAETIRLMEADVKRGMQLAPRSPEMLTAAALLEKKKSNYDAALKLFNQAISLSPKNAVSIKGKADVLYRKGQLDKSLVAYKQALIYDPLSPAILGNIAALNMQAGDINEALEAARTNLKWNGEAAQALNVMSRLVFQQGEYVEAHNLLTKAAKTNPDEEYVQGDLAKFYAAVGLDNNALTTARAPGIKAVIYALTGDATSARNSLQKDPGNKEAHRVFYLLGDYDSGYPFSVEDVADYDMVGDSGIGVTEILWATSYAFVLRQKNDPKAEVLLKKIEKALDDQSEETLQLRDSLLGGAAVKMMRGDQDGALKLLDIAIQKGHVFLKLTRQPIFAPLTKDPNYASRLSAMEATARTYRTAINRQLSNN